MTLQSSQNDMKVDTTIRFAAFGFLNENVRIYGEVLTRRLLSRGFEFEGMRVPLVGPQGIFKPRLMDYPLTITTVPPSRRSSRPYDDGITEDGMIIYRYRGENTDHHENAEAEPRTLTEGTQKAEGVKNYRRFHALILLELLGAIVNA